MFYLVIKYKAIFRLGDIMIKRNMQFSMLTAGYLFPEVARRKREYQAKHPQAKIISLGIGNTTEPLTPHITKALSQYANNLGTKAGYTGYGDDFGLEELRAKIANVLYKGLGIEKDDVFVSDGAKCDIARLQFLFGKDVHIAVQDPAYPVYVDGSVLAGAAGPALSTGYDKIDYMPCLPENDFFPNVNLIKPNSLIYICSPNNPTGAVATKTQLKTLVDYAQKNGCIIIYDSAYSAYIRDKALPRSIYEISGALQCAIEVSSFSKPAGFTGVRLGYTIVPKTLLFEDKTPVQTDWKRLMTTLFNGASNIAQAGGLCALDEEGLQEMQGLVDYYLYNASLIKKALSGLEKSSGITVYAAGNAPYLWVKFPGLTSWQVFDRLLDECNIVTTPGSGFGPSGEHFIRFSSFGHKEDVLQACERLASFKL